MSRGQSTLHENIPSATKNSSTRIFGRIAFLARNVTRLRTTGIAENVGVVGLIGRRGVIRALAGLCFVSL